MGDGYVSRSAAVRWGAGATPTRPLPDVIAGVLTQATGRLIRPDTLWPGVRQGSQYVASVEGFEGDWSASDAVALLAKLGNEHSAHRRLFAVGGPTLLELAGAWQQSSAGSRSARRSGERVTASVVDFLEEEVARLRRLDDGQSGVFVLKAAQHGITMTTELLDQHTYGGNIGNRLLAVAGELSQLAGWISFDLGSHAEAQRYYLLGLRAAHAAGDRRLGALVLSCLAFQQTWRQRPAEAVSLLDIAKRGAKPHATPRLLSLLAMRRARAYAALGLGADAARAMAEAEDQLRAGPHERDPAWLYWLDPSVLLSEQGRCLVQLKDGRRAAHHLKRGLALLDAPRSRDRTMYGLCLAVAHVPHDLEEACHQASLVLPSLGEVGSQRCRELTQALCDRMLSHSHVPFVHDFLGQAAVHLDGKV